MNHFKKIYCTFFSLTITAVLFIVKTSIASATPLQAVHIQSPIKIDGKLDEPDWQKALVSTPFTYLKTNAPSHTPAPTEAHLLADNNAVYIGIRCAEPEMAKLVDAPLPRDGSLWNQDCVELFLSPTGQQTSFYHFMLGANGVQFDDYKVENGTLEGPPYNAIWQSAVYKGTDFWSAEIRIPLSAFSFTDSAQFSSTWLVNIARERKPVPELTSWAPVDTSFSEPQKYFQVSEMPIKPAAMDLQINGGAPVVEAAHGSGAVQLQISAGAAAAGKYQYQIKNAENNSLLKTGSVEIKAGNSTISLNDVSFPTLGKSTFQIALQKPEGQTVAGTYLTSNLAFEPLQISVTQPFYRNCIFPDQQIKQITGTAKIHLLANQLQGATLLASINDSSGKVLFSSKSTLDSHAATSAFSFAINAATLPIGDYTLNVQVQKNNRSLATAKTSIRKLAPAPGSSVRIDSHLNFVADGKPIFPRTWMGNETFLASKTLRDEMHHPGPFVNMWPPLVNAEATRLDPSERTRISQDVMPSQKVFDGLQKSYEDNRDRKDAWCYYLADEPEGRSMSLVYMKHCYDYLQKIDPYHPVMIVSHAPQNYVSVADIISPDSYINPQVVDGKRFLSTPMQVVRQNVSQALAASNGRTAVWDTPQAFNYAGPLTGRLHSDAPNFTEFRCSVYDAIANGAKGIMPFLYSLHFSSWDLRYGVDFVYESLAHLEPMLVAPQEPMHLKVQAPENGVDVWAKNVDGKVLLIAANLLDKNVTAQISSRELQRFSHLTGYREKLSVPLQKGKFSLQFAPYQVHILTSTKMDTGLRSVADVMQQIAIANANRKKPGNILYGRGKEIIWSASDDYMVTKSLWTLTDGITDNLGWQDVRGEKPAFVEMAFPTFTPTFNKAKIYSSTIEDLDFYIWKAGEWQLAGQVKDAKGPMIDLHFGKELSTVKIKIAMPKALPGEKAELNEIELYDNH